MTDAIELDRPRQAILSLSKERGLSLAHLSQKLGKNPSYLHTYIYRGSPRKLDGDDRVLLASLLGVQPTDLLPSEEYTALLAEYGRAAGPAKPALKPVSEYMPVKVQLNPHEPGFEGSVERPPELRGVRGAYAVWIHDDSMEPTFRARHIVHVHPHLPIVVGDDVVLELKNGECYVKNIASMSVDEIVVQQWNPPKKWKIKRSEIKNLDLIVAISRLPR